MTILFSPDSLTSLTLRVSSAVSPAVKVDCAPGVVGKRSVIFVPSGKASTFGASPGTFVLSSPLLHPTSEMVNPRIIDSPIDCGFIDCSFNLVRFFDFLDLFDCVVD